MARIVEIMIVMLCIPLYAVAWPFMVLGKRKAHRELAAQSCPFCNSELTGVKIGDLKEECIKLALKPDAVVFWDGVPQWSLTCPNCNTQICFDRNLQPTACDLSDAFPQMSNDAKSPT